MAPLWVFMKLAWALGPSRAPATKPLWVEWEPGRRDDQVIVKLVEGTEGRPSLPGATLSPLFGASAESLRALRDRLDPDLADLSLYWRVDLPPGWGPAAAEAFNAQPWVEIAYLAYEAQPPPGDIAPHTPDLTGYQGEHDAAPDGFGPDETLWWPGADGAGVTLADLEYSFTRGHEDLAPLDSAQTWGLDLAEYTYHGNMVMGLILAQDNGYGVTGFVPAVTPVMVFPYTEEGVYDLPSALLGAEALLQAGDVLLIEQQSFVLGNYAPVEADPAVFDTITYLVAKGIIVVEPSGNGAQDLDDPVWEGWFDRSVRDSGAILVSGGYPPGDSGEARSWVPYGGCYGSRIDVQAWYRNVTTTSDGSLGDYYADLFFPDRDWRQAYTSHFGGTSAASAIVAGVAAAASSAWLTLKGEPIDPLDLRALMVSTGTPQAATETRHIGPQPDLRRLLRYGLLR